MHQQTTTKKKKKNNQPATESSGECGKAAADL
jgi:hypothetical protein